jgi:hypothetical protein
MSRVEPEALTRATNFHVGLARLIDRDAGRRSGATPSAPPPAATVGRM